MLPFQSPLHSPLWNAAGTLGFAPPRRGPLTLALGAFVTNPISWNPRTPAQGTRMLAFPGGVLLHTGLPNPDFRQVIRDYAGHWGRSAIPVIVHLLVDEVEHVRQMVRQLEEIEGVAGIELGFPPGAGASLFTEVIRAARGELPLIVSLPLNGELPISLPDAISLSPPRGTLPETESGSLVQGRLYGPGLFPQVLQGVWAWGLAGIPIVAGGGVYHPSQAEALLNAGALGVQLDLRLWQSPWPDEAWERWLVKHPSKSSSGRR